MFVSVLEKAESHPGRRVSSHSCLAKVLYRKLTFRAPDFMLAGVVCVTWLHSRGNDRE